MLDDDDVLFVDGLCTIRRCGGVVTWSCYAILVYPEEGRVMLVVR